MLALERSLHESLPIGPEEGQLFYIQRQISNGLRPPPVPLVGVMKNVLVLQWPAASESDYLALISMEEALEDRLDGTQSYVDGHDFGSDEMNLFVHTDQPLDAFVEAQSALGSDPRWAGVRAAYRPTDGEEYTIVWPATLEVFSVS
ncbi:hypothetical protein [Microbacterium panaciterrae]